MTVHPRWRGEQLWGGCSAPLPSGSSPLARGTASPCWRWRGDSRFIPAGAGNRSRPLRPGRSPAVHPRWRGEQLPNVMSPSGVNGSSPLARGTAAPPRLWRLRARFIPAGAGNRLHSGLTVLSLSVHPRWRGEQGFPGRPAQFDPFGLFSSERLFRARCY